MLPNNYHVPYENTQVTVELRKLVENGIKVWDFDYPSFYEGEQKAAFEQKVLDHYWFRQIGIETPARWLHAFRSRIRDIMPYYIQLYESEKYMNDIKDPFATVDLTETFEEERTDTSVSSSRGSVSDTQYIQDDHTRKFSNTPQGEIENLDSYMTEATVETTDDIHSSETATVGSAEGTATGKVKHTYTKFGAQGVTTFGHDMIEFRQSFLNIDLDIIKELNDLFLQVY